MIIYPAVDIKDGRCVRLVQENLTRLPFIPTSCGDGIEVGKNGRTVFACG